MIKPSVLFILTNVFCVAILRSSSLAKLRSTIHSCTKRKGVDHRPLANKDVFHWPCNHHVHACQWFFYVREESTFSYTFIQVKNVYLYE